MYTLIVENEQGNQLELTNCNICEVLKVDGLNPPPVLINTTAVSGVDGAKFNSSRVDAKNIVLLLRVKPPIEYNRQQLYEYFQLKRNCRLYFKNENRDVYIDGYIETFENDQFTMSQQPQISIICPQPYFKSISDTYVELSNTSAAFEFPFSISSEGIEFGTIEKSITKSINIGDIECGGIISFFANTDQILNPIIYNRTTQKYFKVNFDMNKGDLIRICTIPRQKSVTLIRNGDETNIIDKMTEDSKWIEFVPGENEISYGADEGESNLTVNIEFTQQYGGV